MALRIDMRQVAQRWIAQAVGLAAAPRAYRPLGPSLDPTQADPEPLLPLICAATKGRGRGNRDGLDSRRARERQRRQIPAKCAHDFLLVCFDPECPMNFSPIFEAAPDARV